MRSIITGFFMVLLGASAAMAETTPSASKLDHRVRVTRHVDGEVYLLRTAMTRATTVEFEEGERIVSIVAGDTEGFSFESIPGDRVFAVKPTARGVQTNVTVYTDRRSYYFTLREGRPPFYVLRFTYPSRKTQSAGTTPVRSASSRAYGVNERNEITPTAVWDDGAFTYFKFAANAPVPAVFKVTNGLERSVNSQTLKNRVVRVSGVSRQWALRLGEIEVCIAELFNE
ncbi:MAG: TrbG/VirB9 family P-type conjugative transfer protein [Verrucomicrobia bacterium]|jgi:type IV secretion system protein VirB9|nr:TrbG/VirB9 family P-type conjugative transfer protein [Verrucomicrobiota bacterium]